jgi:hypothetical protein
VLELLADLRDFLVFNFDFEEFFAFNVCDELLLIEELSELRLKSAKL